MEIISLIVCTIMVLFVYFKGKITRFGALVAFALGMIIIYTSGYESFMLFFVFFLLSTLAELIGQKKRRNLTKDINKKIGSRDTVQVLSNMGVTTMSLVIYYITNNEMFLIAYACIMATNVAGTLGSKLGVLAHNFPVDITSFKKVNPGISGGITFVGLIYSLFGSFLIAVLFILLNGISITIFLLIFVVGFIGSLLDSLYGSLFQAKYKCNKCSIITEKEMHCDEETKHISGIKWINNDIVNLITRIDVFIIVMIILLIL